MTPIRDRPWYFLSDLHLLAHNDPRTARVLRFLRARRGEAEAVFLVGDVFDLWLGYRRVIYAEFFPVLRAIVDLVESGTRVVLFSGNHDPDPGPFFESQLGVEVHEGPLAFELDGRRIWVEHGDVIDPRGWWRRIVNQAAHLPALRRAARWLHPDLAWRVATSYAQGVGKLKDYRGLPPELVNIYFADRVRAGCDVVIIGHYHRAFSHAEEVGGRSREFHVLGDWLRHFTYLRYDGRFQLLRDRGEDAPPVVLGWGDHRPPN